METVKCALVGRAGEAAVHLHGCVGHHASNTRRMRRPFQASGTAKRRR